MKILVSIKYVIDYNVRIQVKSDGSGIVKNGVKHSINPFDEIAIEEAVRLRERGVADEVVVVTLGNDECVEGLRRGLAFGADRAIHIKEEREIQPLYVAKALVSVFKKERPALFLLGKQAIDDDSNQTGQMIAGLLNLPQATFISKLEINEDN